MLAELAFGTWTLFFMYEQPDKPELIRVLNFKSYAACATFGQKSRAACTRGDCSQLTFTCKQADVRDYNAAPMVKSDLANR